MCESHLDYVVPYNKHAASCILRVLFTILRNNALGHFESTQLTMFVVIVALWWAYQATLIWGGRRAEEMRYSTKYISNVDGVTKMTLMFCCSFWTRQKQISAVSSPLPECGVWADRRCNRASKSREGRCGS